MPKGLLAAATSRRDQARAQLCLQACDGIPDKTLTPGCVLKLSAFLAELTVEVEFLRAVRYAQAKQITELRVEVERIPMGDRP